jgi:hypothetical protein
MRGSSNFYFNNYNSSGEQTLLENLIIESIAIYGQDMYYIPREITNLDTIYTEDDQSQYNSAILLCMYINSIDGFSGDGNFMSKFGVEIRDQVIFSFPHATFNEQVGTITKQPRPNEGDLIYFPLNQKIFQIKFVDKFSMFYQLGALQLWKVTCELFEYSDEQLNTGIPQIDILQVNNSTNAMDWSYSAETASFLTDENNNTLVVEQFNIEQIDKTAENKQIDNYANTFINFSEKNPFGELAE